MTEQNPTNPRTQRSGGRDGFTVGIYIHPSITEPGFHLPLPDYKHGLTYETLSQALLESESPMYTVDESYIAIITPSSYFGFASSANDIRRSKIFSDKGTLILQRHPLTMSEIALTLLKGSASDSLPWEYIEALLNTSSN